MEVPSTHPSSSSGVCMHRCEQIHIVWVACSVPLRHRYCCQRRVTQYRHARYSGSVRQFLCPVSVSVTVEFILCFLAGYCLYSTEILPKFCQISLRLVFFLLSSAKILSKFRRNSVSTVWSAFVCWFIEELSRSLNYIR